MHTKLVTIRHSTAHHILIEFKYTESLDEQAIAKTHSYDTFYRIYQELKENEVETFILSSKTPRDKLLNRYGYRLTDWPGVYKSDNVMLRNIKVLVLNELQNEPHNAFVKCFASRQNQVEEALKLIKGLDTGFLSDSLWDFLAGLQRYILKKGEPIMRKSVTVEDILVSGKNHLQAYLAKLPLEERLRGIKPEEILSRYKPEEVLSQYKPEEVLSQYKPYLAQNQQQAEYRVLVGRTLQIRFKPTTEQLQAIQEQLQKFKGETLKALDELALTSATFAEFEEQLAKIQPFPD